jgi:hypothetical protein
MERSAEQILKKVEQDGSLSRVRENRVAVIGIQGFDLVFAQAARGAKMEVSGVLITKGAMFDFGAMSPISGLVIVFLAKVQFGQRAKARF